MTNTERLIADLELAIKAGSDHVNFMVGRYTGNGTGVLGALRRRGYTVTHNGGRQTSYRLSKGDAK